MLGILDLIGGDRERTGWSFDELHAELGYTRSTLYRYLKILGDFGLVTSLPGIGYTLGPRIIEMDYLIRTKDPLIRVAQPMMEELVRKFPGVALLCRRYRHKVLCVHQESSTDAIRSNYERGKARPLLRGAASVTILAHLQPHQLKRLYRDFADDFAEAGLGTTLQEVKTTLKVHRQQGWTVSIGEVTPGVIGIAAPIFDARHEVLGSLSLTSSNTGMTEERRNAIVEQVASYARIISKSMSR